MDKSNELLKFRRLRDDQGHLLEETALENGVPHGRSQLWSSAGQMLGQAEYRNGELNGEALVWSEAGQLLSKAQYAGGELHGHYQSWWPSGQRKEDGYYDRGVRVAPFKWFDQRGTVIQSLDGIDDERSGSSEVI